MGLISAEPRRWSVAEYRRLAESGFFEGERVELIRGEIASMAPHDPLHSGAVENANTLLTPLFGPGCVVRIQLPFSAPDNSEPEPDVLLLTSEAAREFRAARQHPNSAELVIEVARTSLAYDRTEKSSLYAQAGIPEYWIVNLLEFTIEIHRRPGKDPANLFGWSYAQTERVDHDAQCSFRGIPISPAQLFADLQQP